MPQRQVQPSGLFSNHEVMQLFFLFLGFRRRRQSEPVQCVQTLGIDDVQQEHLRLIRFREGEGYPEGLFGAGREINRDEYFAEQTIDHHTSTKSFSHNTSKADAIHESG